MIKTVAIIVAVLIAVAIAGILILAATKPDTFRVVRTTTIKAPPEKVFAAINDFHSWGAWSPYEKKDPAMKRTLSGAASGKGAMYAWEGDKNVGIGSMEILDTSPPSKVRIRLDFVKPFEAHNIVEFTMEPHGDTTKVTWAMQGPLPYIAKVVHLVFNVDKMVGTDFEIGLANLKALVES